MTETLPGIVFVGCCEAAHAAASGLGMTLAGWACGLRAERAHVWRGTAEVGIEAGPDSLGGPDWPDGPGGLGKRADRIVAALA